jgi:phage terminase large subunit-like protein
VLSPALKELEAAVYDGRFFHNNNPVLNWCMSNVMARETAAGNYTMPDKQRPDNKIDAAIALFISMVRAMTYEGSLTGYGLMFM